LKKLKKYKKNEEIVTNYEISLIFYEEKSLLRLFYEISGLIWRRDNRSQRGNRTDRTQLEHGTSRYRTSKGFVLF